jgi:hypothetical protein
MAASSNRPAPQLYQRLPTPISLRLLKVLNRFNRGQHKLVCSLETFDLTGAYPRYIAPSYTWGAPDSSNESAHSYDDKHDITISIDTRYQTRAHGVTHGGARALLGFEYGAGAVHDLNICRNGWEMLDYFAHMPAGQYYWIDAICINQNDNEERSAQVLLMTKIYAKSDMVILWLGKSVAEEKLLDFWFTKVCNRMLRYLRKTGNSPTRAMIQTSQGRQEARFLGLTISEAALTSIAKLYANTRWFKRAWVVQEVVARGPEDGKCVVCCGHTWIHIGRVYAMAHLMFFDNNLLNLIPARNLPHNIYHTRDGNFRALQHLTLEREPETHASAELGRYLRTSLGARYQFSLLVAYLERLLVVTAWREASEPRDKIYSVLGILESFHLAKSRGPLIIPDYNKALANIYREVTLLCLTHVPHSSIWSLLPARRVRNPKADTIAVHPSRVPDFYYPCRSTQLVNLNAVQPFDAAGVAWANLWQPRSLYHHQHKLCIEARTCDTVYSFRYKHTRQ